MNELNKVRGFLVSAGPSERPGQSLSGLKYFVLGPDAAFFTTSNLALLQFLFSHSETVEKLLENCQRHLSRLRFADRLQVGPIQDFLQPEGLPFFNQKCFSVTMRVLPEKSDPEAPAETREKTFMCFAVDDEVLIPLHAFFTTYHDFVKNPKRRAEFLQTRLELYSQDEDLNSMETLNYKKHLENYKMKMRLLIQKMEADEREIREGVAVTPREVVDESQGASEDKSSKLVKLNNGSLFAGSLKNNRPDGNGKEFLPDGSSYVGDFRNGFWHGSGYLVDSENYICYGEFFEGRVVGI